MYLYAYNREKGRGAKLLPRTQSHHLDDLSDEEIRQCIRERVEAELGDVRNLNCKDSAADVPSVLPVAVVQNVERWLTFLLKRGLDELTVKQHRSYATRYVLEFFGRVAKEPDPSKWPGYSGRYYNWLATSGCRRLNRDISGRAVLNETGQPSFTSCPCSPNQIRRANIALRKFYQWMGEEGVVPAAELRLRSPVTQRVKPQLSKTVSPEEVLSWAQDCSSELVRFIGLVGYFFSLRPQEVFALRRVDFRAGAMVEKLECVRTMKEVDLYTGLVVHIGRQKQNQGFIKDCAKAGSNGWVACFNRDAAREIVDILNRHESEAVVARWKNCKLYTDWRKHGVSGLTVKDLRRASLYWLGHYSKMQPMQLMKHARHRNIETTMIYCQRPEEALLNYPESDLCLEIKS